MNKLIEKFIGVTSDKKQVEVIKITEPISGYPGKDKIPTFQLSTGEHLNPLDNEFIKFQILGSDIKVAIYRPK